MFFATYLMAIAGVVGMLVLHRYAYPTNGRIADQIKACFDNVDLSAQSFNAAGVTITDSNGEKLFYRKGEMDKAIKCLNSLMDNLRDPQG